MNRNTLVFGLIAGAIVSAVMMFSIAFYHDTMDYDNSMLLGYTSMVIAFSFVFRSHLSLCYT